MGMMASRIVSMYSSGKSIVRHRIQSRVKLNNKRSLRLKWPSRQVEIIVLSKYRKTVHTYVQAFNSRTRKRKAGEPTWSASGLSNGQLFHVCLRQPSLRKHPFLLALRRWGRSSARTRRGDLTEAFLRYRFGGLISGGAYFRNFTVL